VYAIPFAVTPEVIFYNVDLLKSVGYETFPETMDDFYAMMDKLVEKGIAPFAPGAKETWRTGHFHNQFLYHWCGVPKAMDLGARKAKWTDEDVVKSLAYVKEMNDRGYFMENCVGLTYDMEKQLFFSQQSAMVNNGSWFIGDVLAAGDLPFTVGAAKFPYFAEKPEFKDHIISYPQHYVLKGGMDEKEKDATARFIKAYTGKENQTRVTAEKGTLPIRKDIDYTGIEVSDLFKQCMDIVNSAKATGGDSFDYDQLSSMQDVTRNAIVGMLLGNSPEQAAAEIQAEIDANG
jgi:ABC-type glycerol-3-phosphate transport system substrate-binding protein